jgi:hypothetical protein
MNWVGMTGTLANFGADIVAGDDSTGVLWILDPNVALDDRTDTGTDAFTAGRRSPAMPCS